jgi:hypothetical protein
MDLEEQLEQVLAQADRDRATDVAGYKWDSLYPSIQARKQEREDSKILHGWESDPRT